MQSSFGARGGSRLCALPLTGALICGAVFGACSGAESGTSNDGTAEDELDASVARDDEAVDDVTRTDDPSEPSTDPSGADDGSEDLDDAADDAASSEDDTSRDDPSSDGGFTSDTTPSNDEAAPNDDVAASDDVANDDTELADDTVGNDDSRAGDAATSQSDTTGPDAGAVAPPSALPSCEAPIWLPEQFAAVYDVGPGHAYLTPSDVPWETLEPGTLVRIFARSEPYRDKWVVNAAGTAEQPVVVLGVPVDGQLPEIWGDGAVTRAELDYWNEERSLIKIGGSSIPDNEVPSYITLECLNLRAAHSSYEFSNAAGSVQSYVENAAAVHIERGEHITLRNCSLTDSGNGLFSSLESSDVLVAGNHIAGNGNVGSIYEHNSYTESLGITFEYNHYGSLCEGCEGNNLKDRSSGTLIRYNWIENGNRQLDLVETDSDAILNDPLYRETYVYGNVLVEGEGQGNRQVIHYGGDGDESRYRAGTLHLYHNTIVSTRAERSTLLRLSSENERAEVTNNVVVVTAGGENLEVLAEQRGQAVLAGNCISSGWTTAFEAAGSGTLEEVSGTAIALSELVDLAAQDFHLVPGAPCAGSAAPLTLPGANFVQSQYVVHQGSAVREAATNPGAFE